MPEPTIGNNALKIEMNPTPAMAAKLVRQRRAMGASFRERQKQQAGVIISKEMNFHHALLQSLVESAHKTFEFGQAGSSLIITAARILGIAKLSAALMPTRRGKNLDRLLSGIKIHARKILDEASDHNCLVLKSSLPNMPLSLGCWSYWRSNALTYSHRKSPMQQSGALLI